MVNVCLMFGEEKKKKDRGEEEVFYRKARGLELFIRTKTSAAPRIWVCSRRTGKRRSGAGRRLLLGRSRIQKKRGSSSRGKG
jgi:hypothetical protein